MTRFAHLLLLAAAVDASASASGAVQPGAGFYDLGDYDYFSEPKPSGSAKHGAQGPGQASLPAGRRALKAPPEAKDRLRATTGSSSQTEARAEARALATPARRAAAGIATAPGAAHMVPGYTAATPAEAGYADDPTALVSSGTSAAVSSEAWNLVTNPDRPAVHLAPGAISRAQIIEREPDSFVDGQDFEASPGACRPLPPSDGPTSYYEATCNEGQKIERSSPTCRIPLVVETRSELRWHYSCETEFDTQRRNGSRLCTPFLPSLETGTCQEIDRLQVGQTCLQWGTNGCVEPGEPIYLLKLSCQAQVSSRSGQEVREGRVVGERRDESACSALEAGQSCSRVGESCTDPGTSPRMINDVPVSRACWAWERKLECGVTANATDCGELEDNPTCRFVREECLDDPQDGACRVREKIFQCPVPGGEMSGAKQYVCGDDVYCINGDCESIDRTASTEFKDALVGLHALGQANAEFDEATLALFTGTRETCHKPVFGLVNCCAGKTSGLLSAASGLAALAGGPGALAALATPFLSYFMCSTSEMQLDIKDRMGFCHKVGTWCSDAFLGVCTSKRTAFCCFESKLSRILQEQGRPQLGRTWDKPKKEQCRGFSVDEFAQLDLSRMDFAEVYAEFVDAAKLPDELATSRAIQERIEDYYRRRSNP